MPSKSTFHLSYVENVITVITVKALILSVGDSRVLSAMLSLSALLSAVPIGLTEVFGRD